MKIRVNLRVEAMRSVGAWFLDEVEKNSSLKGKMRDETFVFLASMARRSGSFIEHDREFLERFVAGWREVLPNIYLLQERPCSGTPESGIHALAEIVVDINTALRTSRGRPSEVDPVEAFETLNEIRKTRVRSNAGVAGDEYSHETAMNVLGIKNKGVLHQKAREGEALSEFFRFHSDFGIKTKK